MSVMFLGAKLMRLGCPPPTIVPNLSRLPPALLDSKASTPARPPRLPFRPGVLLWLEVKLCGPAEGLHRISDFG
eukprot:SAG31_NODE_178_length_21247_cov_11.492009_3_plen_74_part_00